MFLLKLLGTPALVGPEGWDPELSAQPKRLALLGYIATTPGFHSRETLLALLWPDLDQPHARASLRQALYHIRQAEQLVSRAQRHSADARPGNARLLN